MSTSSVVQQDGQRVVATVASSAPTPPLRTAPPPTLERVRVHVLFRTGGALAERDLTKDLLGLRGGGNALPLLCTSHRLNFAAISRAEDPADYFFSPKMAIAAPKLDLPHFKSPEIETKYLAQVPAYNFFNMLALLLPGVEPATGRRSQFVSLKGSLPERATDTRTATSAARLHPSAQAANVATPAAAARGGAGNAVREWTALRLRRHSLQRARALGLLSPPPPPTAPATTTHGGAPTTGTTDTMDTMDTSTYTVFRSTWLTDAVNHPVYAALIRAILEYQRWYENDQAQNADFNPARTRFLNDLTTLLPKKDAAAENIAERTIQAAIDAIAPPVDPKEVENTETVQLRVVLNELKEKYKAVLAFTREERQQREKTKDKDSIVSIGTSNAVPPSRASKNDAITAFIDLMTKVRVSQRRVEGTRSSGAKDPLASARQALSTLAPILAAYQPVETEQLAITAIATMDVQYDSAAQPQDKAGDSGGKVPRLTAKYMEDTYPQFVQVAGALRAFHKTYVPSNKSWRGLIRTIVTDKPRAKGAFLALMYACREMTEGNVIPAAARKKETMAAAPSGSDLLPVGGLDLVLSSKTAGAAGAAGDGPAAAPSGGASALSPLREAYVQCDVVGFAYSESDLGPAVCAFRDFILGVEIRRLNTQPTQWVGQIPEPLFMPPPPQQSAPEPPAKKGRVG